MKSFFFRSAFSLIELMVVITIIGILASGSMVVYTSHLQKVRDTKRIEDITHFQKAISQSYVSKNVFPENTRQSFHASIEEMIQTVPADVKTGEPCHGGAGCWYLYRGGRDENNIEWGAYVLSTAFESKVKTEETAARDRGGISYRYEVFDGLSTLTTEWQLNPTAATLLPCKTSTETPAMVLSLWGSIGNVLCITGTR